VENDFQKYWEIFDSMEIGVIYQDRKGKVIYINDAAKEILGLPSEMTQNLKAYFEELQITKDDGSPFSRDEYPPMIALVTGKKLKNVVIGIYNKQLKQKRWLSVRAIPEFRINEKKPFRVYTTINDITKLKLIQDKCSENEERYRSLIEQGSDAMFLTDFEGTIVEVNERACKSLGYTYNELLGKKVSDLDPEFIKNNHKENIWSNLVPGKPVTLHSKHKRKDGTTFPVEIRVGLTEIAGKKYILGFAHDITERKKAEEQLKLIQFGIDHSQIAVFQVNDDGKIYYVNEQACKNLGYTTDELLKLNIWDIDPNLDSEKWKIHRKKTRSQVNTIIETNHIRKDGTQFPAEVAINFLEYEGRHISFSFARDITEQKKAEKSLQASEKRFRAMIEHSADAITLISSEGNIIYESPNAAKLSGYPIHERIGKSGFDNLHPLDLDKIKDIFGRLLSNPDGTEDFEFRAVRKDGSVWWAEGSATNLLHEPNIEAIVVNYRDITQRKKVGEELSKSEERFRRIFQEGQFGITIASPDLKFINANPAFCRMIGYTVDELKTMSFADITHPDIVDNNVDRVKDLTAGKINQIRLEKQYVKKNSDLLWGSLISTAIRDDDGKVLYYLAMVQDITDHKNAEEALKKQNLEYLALNKVYLAQNEELIKSLKRIKDINTELEKAKEKAEESDKLKTAFLANMSHEIRTPMNGILGFADLLKEPNITGKQKQRYLQIIQQSGQRMLDIINDLIDISKIEAGQIEIKHEKTNINQLLNSLYIFFNPETQKKGLNLEYTNGLSGNKSIIKTDRTKLGQVISNLIKNAIKYTNEGGINFGYTLKEKAKDGKYKYLEFFVKDTGIGIEPDVKDKIFERFWQANVTDTKVYEGTGLGLSISRAYIKMLGGDIWVKSKPGSGSAFHFTIPYSLTRESGQPKKYKDLLEGKTHQDMTILIAEDDLTSFIFLREILKSTGANILHARDGGKAVEIIKSNPDVTIVLMDLKMPVFGGLDATKQIKQLRPDLPVIAQTAFASPSDEKRSLDAGCDDYLVKPIKKELLIEKIAKYIN
jgi:PAS domain S-box-containing protein